MKPNPFVKGLMVAALGVFVMVVMCCSASAAWHRSDTKAEAPTFTTPAPTSWAPRLPYITNPPTVYVTPEPTSPPTKKPTVKATKPPTKAPTKKATKKPTPKPYAYYKNCAAVRAAGKAPLYAGEPGYRAGLDRDHDGKACEDD